jgi:hypothetical protein
MITRDDCITMCGLSEEEVLAIAQHEPISKLAIAVWHSICYVSTTARKGSAACCETISALHWRAAIVSMPALFCWLLAIT